MNVLENFCLSSSVRISALKSNVIISNLANGKWMMIKQEMLQILFLKTREEMIVKGLKIGISRKDVNNFITILIDYSFIGIKSREKFEINYKSLLRSAYLNVTNCCNLSCIHCYYSSKPHLDHGMDIERMFSVVDSLYEANIRFITISGGEALMKPKIEALFQYLKLKGFHEITLLTNGTLISKRIASVITENIDQVKISLDGSDEEINSFIRGKGNFHKTINGIKNLKEAGMKNIHIITTITSNNINFLDKINELCNCIGVEFGTSIFTPVGNGKCSQFLSPSISGLIHYFKRKIKKEDFKLSMLEHSFGIDAGITCGCGIFMVSVDCNGDVFPCHLFHSSEMKIGNLIKNKDLVAMIEKSSIIKKIRMSVVENRECHGCSVEYFCKGGCLARTVAANNYSKNSWFKRDPLCKLHKQILSNQLLDKF